MGKHGIPFSEELSNNQLWFLIPGKHRPHLWKLDKDPGEPAENSASTATGMTFEPGRELQWCIGNSGSR